MCVKKNYKSDIFQGYVETFGVSSKIMIGYTHLIFFSSGWRSSLSNWAVLFETDDMCPELVGRGGPAPTTSVAGLTSYELFSLGIC